MENKVYGTEFKLIKMSGGAMKAHLNIIQVKIRFTILLYKFYGQNSFLFDIKVQNQASLTLCTFSFQSFEKETKTF